MCRNHLLGEHRELHAIWNILVFGKRGYAFHPETLRWKGKRKALFLRHKKLVQEMKRRGYNHQSPLNPTYATGETTQSERVDTLAEQIRILRNKNCGCQV